MVKDCRLCPYRTRGPLGQLPEDCVADVSMVLRRYSIARSGDTVLHQGQPVDSYFFLCEGVAKRTRVCEGGQEITVDLHEPCSLIATTTPSLPFSVVSTTEGTVVGAVQCGNLLSLCKKHPGLIEALCSDMTTQLHNTVRKLASTASSATERLLFCLATTIDPALVEARLFPIRLTNVELARLALLTPETTSRVMTDLRKKGVIVQRKGKQVIRREALLKYIGE